MVNKLDVSMVGLPPQLETAMSQLADQIGVNHFPSSNPDTIVYWYNKDIDEECKTAIPVSYGCSGIRLDGTPSGEKIPSLYEPSVATIAASLIWAEVLRRNCCLLPVEIPKITVSVNLRIDERTMRVPMDNIKMSLDGHKVYQNIRSTNDGTGHRRLSLRLDDNDSIVVDLKNKLIVSQENENASPSIPVMEFNLRKPLHPPKGHITIVGAGGLGTWVLNCLAAGLENIDTDEISFLVFDKDLTIEEHNLNRQVIYSESDIGKSKADASKEWLKHKLPNLNISTALELHDLHLSPPVAGMDPGIGISLDDLEGDFVEENNNYLTDYEIQRELLATDAIVGCLDAMRPRSLADLMSARLNQPYINGGVGGLLANYCEFVDSSLVSIHGPEIARDTAVQSCQVDGDIPTASIALTNSLVGALQSLAALERISGYDCASIRSVNWEVRTNSIWCNCDYKTIDRFGLIKDIERALKISNRFEMENV
jgi:molybdopterin/thiamine biosynthesis adenylyltransferase